MVFSIFLKQELRNNFRNSGLFAQNILFFIISCAIFLIISQNGATQGQTQLINIILISLIFCLIFANGNFLQEDFRDGTLEQMIIFCPNLEIYIAAKIIANWFVFALPVLLSIFPIMWLSGLETDVILDVFVLFFLASFSINFICAFCASLGLSANKAPMIALFVFPLIVPILLIAISGLESAQSYVFAIKFLIAMVIFCGAITLLATTKIVRIVSE